MYDYNDCTVDTCDANGVCTFPLANDGASCDDGLACTVNDGCLGGACGGTPTDTLCDDGDVCTNGQCDGSTGCFFTNNTAPCNDNDNNVCTDGSCAGGVCQPTANSAPCDDGNPYCTFNDICANGTCTGTPIVCNTGNFCTFVDCNPTNGCQDPPLPICVPPTGVCINNLGDQRCAECEFDTDCTADPIRNVCDAVAGVCVQCTVGGGQCVAPLPACDDGTGTCVQCVLTTDCVDDGNPCTQQECHAADNNTCDTITIPGCCQTDADCPDPNPNDDPNNPCTKNICNQNTCVEVLVDNDGDTVGNCVDQCIDDAGCPLVGQFNGCPCVCCDPAGSCCDPNTAGLTCACP